MHLMRSITVPEIRNFHQHFMQKTIRFRDKNAFDFSHGVPLVQTMDIQEVQQGIKFVREQLTHLDPHLVQDTNLRYELFMDYEKVINLAKALRNPAREPIMGKINYHFLQEGTK